jgi:predicted secreted protein
MSAPASQQDAIQAFIDLANEMKNEGATIQFVSTALMRACAVYSTYVVAGNEGALKKSGVEKLKELFAHEVDTIQLAKLKQAGINPTGAG